MSSSSPRALLLSDTEPLCEDIDQAVLRVAHLLSAQVEVDILFFTPELSPATVTTKRERGVAIYYLGIPLQVQSTLEVAGDFLRLLWRRGRYSLFHSFRIFTATYCATFWGRYFEIPVVLDLRRYELERCLWNPEVAAMAQWALASLSALRVTSDDLSRKVKAFLPDQVPVVLIPDSVDTDLFQPKKPIDLGLPEGKRIAFFADPHTCEGLKNLLHAFQLARQKEPQLHLLLLGELDSGAIQILHSFQSNLRGYLHTFSLPEREELPYWLSQVDVLAIPCLRGDIPLFALEAMACEVPLVAFQIGGIEEPLGPSEERGFLAPPGNPRLFAAKLLQALEENSAEKARSARQWILEHHTHEQEKQALLELYQRFVS